MGSKKNQHANFLDGYPYSPATPLSDHISYGSNIKTTTSADEPIGRRPSVGARIVDLLIEIFVPWLLLLGVPILFVLAITLLTFLPGGGNYDKYIAPIFESSQSATQLQQSCVTDQAASGVPILDCKAPIIVSPILRSLAM
ncbi:hypothetical protein [Bifidobacterium tissieri]|uniref:hypothetical protein n=1 Tax=Bifidobacterium tissieri TaxID=1630162 RepID=UPI00123B6F33|nr:hypothetical protein [Bifidobacterium tissieri]KAA8830160.1 hypothetical protein EM849_10300 [Bifidobacterium tissieri]